MADSTGLGYRDDAIVFATGIAIVAAVYLWTKTPRTLLFWIAFVLTRPLGATLGDFLDKPLDYGGLLSAATRPRSFSRSQSSHSSSPCRSEHRHPDRRRLARQRPDLVIPSGGVFNRRRLPPSGRKAARDGRGRLTPGLYRAQFCSSGPLTSIRWHRCQSLPAPAGLCSHRLMPCNTSARTQIQLTIRIFKPVNVNLSTRRGPATPSLAPSRGCHLEMSQSWRTERYVPERHDKRDSVITRPLRSRPGRLPHACAVDGCAGYGQARRHRAAAARSGFLRAPGWQAPNVQVSSV